MFTLAGTTPKRRNGLARKSARDLRAGQSGNGVSREAGRASCLLDKRRIKDHTGKQDPSASVRFRLTNAKKEKAIRGNQSRAECEGGETGRGSLSILIVAIESRETIPRKPVSSQGRYRVSGLVVRPT